MVNAHTQNEILKEKRVKRLEVFLVLAAFLWTVFSGFIAYKLLNDENVICNFSGGTTKSQETKTLHLEK